jgi:hypothetical protein
VKIRELLTIQPAIYSDVITVYSEYRINYIYGAKHGRHYVATGEILEIQIFNERAFFKIRDPLFSLRVNGNFIYRINLRLFLK